PPARPWATVLKKWKCWSKGRARAANRPCGLFKPLVSNSPLSATLPPFRIMAAARRNNAASDSIKQSTLNHQFSKWADTPDQKPKLAAVTAFRFSDHPNRSSEKTTPLG